MRVFLMTMAIGISSSAVAVEEECLRWFKATGLSPGKGCLLSCTSSKTDMGTFPCPNSCDELCQEPGYVSSTMNLSRIYGLTPSERALVVKEPVKTLKAYNLSLDAERLCLKLYFKSQTNDESDACRHFVWAALLTRELGLEFGNQILNAHEQDAYQPEKEKAMDLANNRQGQISLQSLKSRGDKDILESFKENIKHQSLIILKASPKNKRDQK